MDINSYKNYSLKTKDTLAINSEGIFLSDENFIGGITYYNAVNNGDDLTLGSACLSYIEFELNNLNLMINQLSGKEVIWKTGIEIGNRQLDDIVKRTKSNLICLNQNIAFVNNKGLKMFDINTFEQILVDDAPTLNIYSLFIADDTLYCGHNEHPYITVYKINGNSLTRVPTPALNDFQIEKILYYNANNISFNKQGNILNEYEVTLYDLKPKSLIETTYEFTQMGVFKLDKPVRVNDTRIKVTAYDRMTLFDRNIDELVNSITYPITLSDLLNKLCGYVGVVCKTPSFLNCDFQVKKNFIGDNVSGRQLLQWIAEIAGKFAVINELGELEIKWYETTNYVIDETCYSEVEVSDYEVKEIDKLQIQVEENDIGVVTGEGSNAYVIQNNPLLYAEHDSELRTVIDNIFNFIKGFNYYPYSITVLPNPLIKAGHIVTINTSAGKSIKAIIMSRTFNKSCDVYEATGNENRTPNQSINSSIIALRGATNVLNRSIEETKSIITSVEKGLQSQIIQNAEQISLRVTKTEYSNDKEVTDNRISQAESEILQNAKEISLKVSQTDYNGNTISSLINQTATTIQIQANKINLTGYTTFTDLSTSGKTSINGANIQTGTIGADKIKTNELIVGTNIAMGSNATINWSNVTGTGNVAELSDIPSDSYITQITKDMIKTDYIYARNLEVDAANIRGTIVADSVDASNITGSEIYGLTLRTGGGVEINSNNITFGNGSGEIYYGGGTFKFYSYGNCSFDADGDIYLMPWNAVRVSGDLRISGDLYINNQVVDPTVLLKMIEQFNEGENNGEDNT